MRSYNITLLKIGSFWDGQESNETTRMDTRAGPHIEGACPEENTRGPDRQDAKADSRRNAAKSI
jgi:hypothetical protein